MSNKYDTPATIYIHSINYKVSLSLANISTVSNSLTEHSPIRFPYMSLVIKYSSSLTFYIHTLIVDYIAYCIICIRSPLYSTGYFRLISSGNPVITICPSWFVVIIDYNHSYFLVSKVTVVITLVITYYTGWVILNKRLNIFITIPFKTTRVQRIGAWCLTKTVMIAKCRQERNHCAIFKSCYYKAIVCICHSIKISSMKSSIKHFCMSVCPIYPSLIEISVSMSIRSP